MNNYSPLQRFLHRTVLSSKLMREIMFDIEQSLFLKKNENFDDAHVFVAGLARSGTTVLLNAIHASGQFASLSYDDMPFILAPNFWAKISPIKNSSEYQERAHGDNIRVSSNSPEAFEEVFWETFGNDSQVYEELFLNFISLVLKKNNKARYLSKNNQNIRRLDYISQVLPHSKILIPFREPTQQASSLFFQHKKFINMQNEDVFVRNYMKWIGHSEFGLDYKMIKSSNLLYPDAISLNHWLEQWYLTYKPIFELSSMNRNIHLIDYKSLCNDPNVWTNIKSTLEINHEVKFSFNETIKTINFTYDSKLSDKCSSLYESLVALSL